MREPDLISNEYAYIVPHKREKGGFGYVLQPCVNHAHLLTDEEMTILLRVYIEMLKRHEYEVVYGELVERKGEVSE